MHTYLYFVVFELFPGSYCGKVWHSCFTVGQA